jgi:hypothetical protein
MRALLIRDVALVAATSASGAVGVATLCGMCTSARGGGFCREGGEGLFESGLSTSRAVGGTIV